MSLLFDNVELLGYTHQNNFFGEQSLCYSSTRTVSIRGYILDLVGNDGVGDIFNDVNELLKETTEFQNIVINNENFGTGKIKSFSVDAGNWVRTTQYTAEIETLLQVPIENINSDEFQSLNLNNKNFNLLKSFSESFSIDFNEQNKVLGGEHSIEIEYDSNNKNINTIRLAQILASELLKTIPSHSSIAEGNYSTRSTYKTLISENYDLINGKCGFKKSFSYNTLNNTEPYSFIRTHSVSINENGIATVNENCVIKAESDNPSLYQNALSGYNSLVQNVFTRCDSVFQIYKTKFDISENLNQYQINKSVEINKVNGVITFNITFDNDPKKKNPTFLWEYVSTLDKDDTNIWTVSENGSINGVGKIGSIEKYTNAENAWTNTVKNNISTRSLNFYNNESTNGNGGPLKDVSKKIARNKFDGKIDYNFTYTDDPTIRQNDPDNIKKVSIDKSDTGLLPIIKNFIIPNNTYTLVQNRNFLKQGVYTIKLNLSIGCTNNVFNGFSYFNKAKSLAGSPVGVGNDIYLESINYSSDEIEKTISYEATYKYS